MLWLSWDACLKLVEDKLRERRTKKLPASPYKGISEYAAYHRAKQEALGVDTRRQ